MPAPAAHWCARRTDLPLNTGHGAAVCPVSAPGRTVGASNAPWDKQEVRRVADSGQMPRETRLERGRRRGRMLIARSTKEMRDARLAAGLTHDEAANAIGIARSNVTRLEAGRTRDIGIVRLSEIASVLGYEVRVGLHPIGDPVRDKGQLACGRRFDALLSSRWLVTDETLLPGAGELRVWDCCVWSVRARPTWWAWTSRAACGTCRRLSAELMPGSATVRSTTS